MFSRGGFDAKAVAIYKQILRVEEDALEARTRLGECFQRMGLTSDALREFQDAFKICQKRELKREAFELLRRVASLDPSNIANRLNLAGLFAREGMQDDAKREFASLLEEVRRQTGTDLVVRVAEQMMHAFPDSREALDALVWAKLSNGAHADAIALLKPVVARAPEDISLRESLVSAYEAAGDATAVKRLWREIAEMYKRRGDVDKSRDIMQRYAAVEEFTTSDENTAPSILLTDSTGGMPDGDVLELDDVPPRSQPSVVSAKSAPRMQPVVEKGRATPPPVRPPLSSQKRVASSEPASARGSSGDLLAEARVSLEFGDPEEAARLARRVLETEPDSADAHALLAETGFAPEPAAAEPGGLPSLIERNESDDEIDFSVESVPAPTFESSLTRPEVTALAPGEDYDTLPDIEIVLEDEEDRDEHFASIDPPLELELGPDPTPLGSPMPRAKSAPAPADSFDIEIEVEGESDADLSLEFSQPLTVSPGDSFGDASLRIAENLTEADFYLEQGLVDEAERIYAKVLEQVPHHPKAMLRMGEIAARRKPAATPRVVESANLEADFGDTMVHEPDGTEALSLPEIAAAVQPLDIEPSVIGEDTIPPLELEPALQDELVFAQDTDSPVDLGLDLDLDSEPALDLLPEPEPEPEPEADAQADVESDEGFDETSHSSDEEGEFDLAAMLDDEDGESSGSIGTLIGVGAVGRGFAEVFSAFKKGIQEQVEEGDADTHYDLAIAYKEMGLHEDAVRELEAVLRTGTRAIEALSLLANCKLALGDAAAAAGHLEDALQRAGDSDESAVSLRYDLGEALLAGGRESEALEAFQKVAAADPDFRDVVERISRFG
jgi:tetratricopeptide (TPR) repeat protein